MNATLPPSTPSRATHAKTAALSDLVSPLATGIGTGALSLAALKTIYDMWNSVANKVVPLDEPNKKRIIRVNLPAAPRDSGGDSELRKHGAEKQANSVAGSDIYSHGIYPMLLGAGLGTGAILMDKYNKRIKKVEEVSEYDRAMQELADAYQANIDRKALAAGGGKTAYAAAPTPVDFTKVGKAYLAGVTAALEKTAEPGPSLSQIAWGLYGLGLPAAYVWGKEVAGKKLAPLPTEAPADALGALDIEYVRRPPEVGVKGGKRKADGGAGRAAALALAKHGSLAAHDSLEKTAWFAPLAAIVAGLIADQKLAGGALLRGATDLAGAGVGTVLGDTAKQMIMHPLQTAADVAKYRPFNDVISDHQANQALAAMTLLGGAGAVHQLNKIYGPNFDRKSS